MPPKKSDIVEDPVVFLTLDPHEDEAGFFLFVDDSGVIRGVDEANDVKPRAAPALDGTAAEWPAALSNDVLGMTARRSMGEMEKVMSAADAHLDDGDNIALVGPEAPVLALLLFLEPSCSAAAISAVSKSIAVAVRDGILKDGDGGSHFGCSVRVKNAGDFDADDLVLGGQPLLCAMAKMRPAGAAAPLSESSSTSAASSSYARSSSSAASSAPAARTAESGRGRRRSQGAPTRASESGKGTEREKEGQVSSEGSEQHGSDGVSGGDVAGESGRGRGRSRALDSGRSKGTEREKVGRVNGDGSESDGSESDGESYGSESGESDGESGESGTRRTRSQRGQGKGKGGAKGKNRGAGGLRGKGKGGAKTPVARPLQGPGWCAVSTPTGVLARDRGVLGSVAFGNLNIGNANPRDIYNAIVHCADDNHGKEVHLLGQRKATAEGTAVMKIRAMGKERVANVAEHRTKWPDPGARQVHVACIDVSGHAHPDTLRSGTGPDAWINGSYSTTVRFSEIVAEAARAFPASSGTVVLHFTVCYLAGPGLASTRKLAKLTARHPHVEIVLHDKKLKPEDGLFFVTVLVTRLLAAGPSSPVREAVDAAAEHMLDHRILHVARGEVRSVAARKRKVEAEVLVARTEEKRPRACPPDCASVAHYDTGKLAAMVDTEFAPALPPMDAAEIARRGYRPARLRVLWKAHIAGKLGREDPHALRAWNAMRDACASGKSARLRYSMLDGFGRFEPR